MDDEIEITDVMLEAGLRAANLYDREDPKEWEVAAIFRAMVSVSQRATPNTEEFQVTLPEEFKWRLLSSAVVCDVSAKAPSL